MTIAMWKSSSPFPICSISLHRVKSVSHTPLIAMMSLVGVISLLQYCHRSECEEDVEPSSMIGERGQIRVLQEIHTSLPRSGAVGGSAGCCEIFT